METVGNFTSNRVKTYILDAVNRCKKFSESLDVKATLCSKSWSVFNDTGIKEIYLFQHDGSLIISVSGEVTDATWKYIPVNQSILISTKIGSYMLHPTFIDNIIFALQLDGTNQYSFMIDELQRDSFAPKCLSDIENYFRNKELEAKQQENIAIANTIRIERENQRKQEAIQDAQLRQRQCEDILKSDLVYIELKKRLKKVTAYRYLTLILFGGIAGYIEIITWIKVVQWSEKGWLAIFAVIGYPFLFTLICLGIGLIIYLLFCKKEYKIRHKIESYKDSLIK